MKKRFMNVGIVATALLAGGLVAATVSQAGVQNFQEQQSEQGCTDRVTGGGFIVVGGDTIHANFGAHGGIHHDDLKGNLNYVDHDSTSAVRHVKSKTVVAYCVGCVDRDCRRITYSPATVDGVQVDAVIIEVCDNNEPGVEDTFSICIPSLGYCRGGVLGGDDKPSGGNIQLHAKDPGCGGEIPVCTTLTTCLCFPLCP